MNKTNATTLQTIEDQLGAVTGGFDGPELATVTGLSTAAGAAGAAFWAKMSWNPGRPTPGVAAVRGAVIGLLAGPSLDAVAQAFRR
jgi:hypothetical protein